MRVECLLDPCLLKSPKLRFCACNDNKNNGRKMSAVKSPTFTTCEKLLTSKVPYCYLFSRELNFAKMERAYFAGLHFRDLAKKYVKNIKNTLKTLKIRFRGSLISRFFENREN